MPVSVENLEYQDEKSLRKFLRYPLAFTNPEEFNSYPNLATATRTIGN